jgi:geranylgeranyl diphosphate synthase, type I
MTVAPSWSRGRTGDLVRTLVEPAMRELVERMDPRNRLVAGYQLGFWDADGAPAGMGNGSANRGKCIRPTLALLCARAAGAPPEAGVPAAVAVELAHNFSLLHDDVMDRDTERRHRATAWVVFGIGPAILAGDALINLAYQALSTTALSTTALSTTVDGGSAVRRLADDVDRLVAGQAADLDFERRDLTGPDAVGLDECLRMAADKTAALLSCSCALGALVGGAPAELTAGLSRFGAHLGLAFQLVDDLLGIWGEPARTGKPVGSDVRTRKKSVPVVYAARSATAAGDAFAELYRVPRPLTGDDVALATRLIEASGARDWTRRQAEREATAARTELRRLGLPEELHRELAEMASFSTERDY